MNSAYATYLFAFKYAAYFNIDTKLFIYGGKNTYTFYPFEITYTIMVKNLLGYRNIRPSHHRNKILSVIGLLRQAD